MGKIFVLFAIILAANARKLPIIDEKSVSSSESDELDLSPKLMTFFERLLALNPKLIETGEARLEARQRFGINQLDEVLAEATAQERNEFFESLAGVETLYQKHPKAKQLIENLLGLSEKAGKTASEDSSEEFLGFFMDFSLADKELSQFPEWNRYWNLWFKKHADYMAKYG